MVATVIFNPDIEDLILTNNNLTSVLMWRPLQRSASFLSIYGASTINALAVFGA